MKWKAKWQTVACSLAMALASGQTHARMNFIEAFTESNVGQCVEFNLDGAAFFTKLSFSIFPPFVSVKFFLSPVTSHYNPDFLVTSYSRLGDSPLFESYIALGRPQNTVAKPMVELLTGREVPQTWYETDQWSGVSSDHKRESHTSLQYYESEVFGHPGNIYTWASKAYRGELGMAVPGTDLLTVIPASIAAIPNHVGNVLQDVANNAGTTLGAGFSEGAKETFDPVALAKNAFVGELQNMVNDTQIGLALDRVVEGQADDLQEEAVIVYQNTLSSNLSVASDAAADAIPGRFVPPVDPNESVDPSEDPDEPTTFPRIDIAGLPDQAVEELRERFGGLSAANIASTAASEVGEATEKVQEIVTLFQTLNEGHFADIQQVFQPGVSFEPMGFSGFCPSDVREFRPYYLSGTNILSWRFKIPELVYPQTYVPFSNKTTIGELFPGTNNNPFTALAESQNYGSVYPRNGYLLQPDRLKAAAVTAFRAAHVVTRPGQPHIYREAKAVDHPKFMEFDNGYETFKVNSKIRKSGSVYLNPFQDEKGRWQLVYSEGAEIDKSCHRFGSPDVNPSLTEGEATPRLIGDVENSLPIQWTENKVSQDGDYIFNLWRRYRCAPEPQGSNVFHLFNIVLPSPISIIN